MRSVTQVSSNTVCQLKEIFLEGVSRLRRSEDAEHACDKSELHVNGTLLSGSERV